MPQISSRLKRARFDWGRSENPGYKHKEINLEKLQDGRCIFYLIKYKTKNHTVHTCVNAGMYTTIENLCFQSKGTRHQ